MSSRSVMPKQGTKKYVGLKEKNISLNINVCDH